MPSQSPFVILHCVQNDKGGFGRDDCYLINVVTAMVGDTYGPYLVSSMCYSELPGG
jgi:hypothetical protein